MTFVALKGVFGLRRSSLFLKNQSLFCLLGQTCQRTGDRQQNCDSPTSDRDRKCLCCRSIVDKIKIAERQRPTSALQHIYARLFCLREAGNGGKAAETTSAVVRVFANLDFDGFSVSFRQTMSRMAQCHPLLFSHGLQLHSPTCQLSSGTFVVHPAEYL